MTYRGPLADPSPGTDAASRPVHLSAAARLDDRAIGGRSWLHGSSNAVAFCRWARRRLSAAAARSAAGGILFAFVLAGAAPARAGDTYTLPNDFTLVNPVGPWSWGRMAYGNDVNFLPIEGPIKGDSSSSSSHLWGLSYFGSSGAFVGTATTDIYLPTVFYPYDRLAVKPGDDWRVAIRFTAPKTAAWNFYVSAASYSLFPYRSEIHVYRTKTGVTGVTDITADVFGRPNVVIGAFKAPSLGKIGDFAEGNKVLTLKKSETVTVAIGTLAHPFGADVSAIRIDVTAQ